MIAAGGDPRKVVFSGLGKTTDEIEFALRAGIRGFNVEPGERTASVMSTAPRRVSSK